MVTEFVGEFADRLDADGTELNPASFNALTERRGGVFKRMFYQAIEHLTRKFNKNHILEMIGVMSMLKNRLLVKGGYSPIQRVFGYTPRMLWGELFRRVSSRART